MDSQFQVGGTRLSIHFNCVNFTLLYFFTYFVGCLLYVVVMAQAKNMTPLQRKPFEGWAKEDMVWINPAGKKKDFIHICLHLIISL